MTFYIAPETAKDQKQFQIPEESIPAGGQKKQADGYQIKIARKTVYQESKDPSTSRKTQK